MPRAGAANNTGVSSMIRVRMWRLGALALAAQGQRLGRDCPAAIALVATRKRFWVTAAIVATTTIAALYAGPADAAVDGYAESSTRSSASCRVQATLQLDPGLPVADSSSPVDFTSTEELLDEPGHAPIVCTKGRVNGVPVIPNKVGSYIEYGWTTGDCLAGSGIGTFHAWIPTMKGIQYVTGDFSLSYNGKPLSEGQPVGTGFETGDNINATFTFRPTKGTCQSTDPLKEFFLDQNETLYT